MLRNRCLRRVPRTACRSAPRAAARRARPCASGSSPRTGTADRASRSTVPSSVDWIASVTRYVPSSNGTCSKSKVTSPSPSATGTGTSMSLVLVPKMLLPSSSWIAIPKSRSSVGSSAWYETRIDIASSGSSHCRPTSEPGCSIVTLVIFTRCVAEAAIRRAVRRASPVSASAASARVGGLDRLDGGIGEARSAGASRGRSGPPRPAARRRRARRGRARCRARRSGARGRRACVTNRIVRPSRWNSRDPLEALALERLVADRRAPRRRGGCRGRR